MERERSVWLEALIAKHLRTQRKAGVRYPVGPFFGYPKKDTPILLRFFPVWPRVLQPFSRFFLHVLRERMYLFKSAMCYTQNGLPRLFLVSVFEAFVALLVHSEVCWISASHHRQSKQSKKIACSIQSPVPTVKEYGRRLMDVDRRIRAVRFREIDVVSLSKMDEFLEQELHDRLGNFLML